MARHAVRNNRARALALLLALLLALSGLAAAPADAYDDDDDDDNGDDGEVEFVLTVLHNNDGESQLLADEVAAVEGGFEKGVAYFATLLRNAKRETRHPRFGPFDRDAKRGVIFVSSGDNFLAGPQFDASLADGVFYDAIALDRMRYTAIDLGNHDFDFGPDLLAEFIGEGFRRPGRPPYLSANLDFSGEPTLQALVDDGVIAKTTVVRTRGERIGIIGATTPNLPFISSPRNVVVDPNVAAVVQAEIDRLEDRDIDKIVLISHLQDIDADIALAGALSGIDIMVAGGGDELLADPCNGASPPDCDLLLPSDGVGDVFGSYPQIATNLDGFDVPVVTTSGQYGYVGQLVVAFNEDGEVVAIDDDNSGPRRVVSTEVGPDGVRPNRVLQRKVVEPVEAHVAELAANIIATSEVDLDGVRGNVRSMETNEGNLIADALKWQAEQLASDFGVPVPDVALQNGGGIRNDSIIPAGSISELDTFSMVPFPNFVSVFPAIPRSQFKEIMENAVSRAVAGDIPGGTGRFAQISGFSFTWDANGTAQVIDPATGLITTPGTRVQEVTLDGGTPIVTLGAVVPGPDLTVATIDFLARGGDQYPFRGEPFTVLGASYQQALSNYIQDALGGVITAADYPEGGEGRNTRLN